MFNQTTTTNAAGDRGAEPQAKLGAAVAPQAPAPPDPELQERPRRRRFSAQHKLEVLRKADACKPGELGALLRREGIYSSNLSNWRRQREEGALGALERKRGRKPADKRDSEIAALEGKLARTEAELTKAHKVIEVQGKLSALLEQMLSAEGAQGPGSDER